MKEIVDDATVFMTTEFGCTRSFTEFGCAKSNEPRDLYRELELSSAFKYRKENSTYRVRRYKRVRYSEGLTQQGLVSKDVK